MRILKNVTCAQLKVKRILRQQKNIIFLTQQKKVIINMLKII